MKLCSFSRAGQASWGIVSDADVIDTGVVLRSEFPDLKSLLAAQALSRANDAALSAPRYTFADIQWEPVIPNPDKILCVGLNYESHRVETGRSAVENPTIFARFGNSQTGHLRPIVRPRVSTDLDYEGELSVVISKRGRYIPQAEAMSYIAGYAPYNDGSLRDYQRHTHQFTPGKNFPNTGAFGPWMVTRNEVGPIDGLRIQTRLNGQVMQEAAFDQMIFKLPRLIEYCSEFTQLEPGDVIVTGTPGGVGMKRTPPVWMKPGDVVEVEIDRVGILRNVISDEFQEGE